MNRERPSRRPTTWPQHPQHPPRCKALRLSSYPDLEAAIAGALRRSAKYGHTLHPFPCQSCPHWHLAHAQPAASTPGHRAR